MRLRNLYEADAKRIVAVMAGGFHPFHPGHKSLYDWAVKTFGKENVYVAATNDVTERPFPFDIKKKLATMAGVPAERFLQINTSPFNARAYTDLLDSNTALVFIRSDKDRNEAPLPDKMKIDRKTKQLTNEPRYIRSWTGKDVKTHDEMGYMAYGPTINFNFGGMQIKSASELRAKWPELSDNDKMKMAEIMYGRGAKAAVGLLNQALGDPEAPVGEGIEEENKGLYYNVNKRKKAGTSRKKGHPKAPTDKAWKDAAKTAKESLEEAQTGDVYMRFKVRPPLDKNRGKPTLMVFAGFANTPGELTLDTAKMNFNVLTKKQDIVNAVKKVIGDKIFIGAEKVVVYNDGAVNPKKFPQYSEFLDWIQKFGKEKVQVVDKPDSDETGEKGPGKKRVKAKWANKKNYTDDNIEATKYFTIDNNRLMKFLQKSAPKIMQAYRPASKQFVMEPAQYKTFRNWMRSPDVVSKFGDTNVKVDKSKSFSQSVGKEFEQIEEDIPAVGDIAAMAAVAGLAAPVMASLIKGAYKTGKNLLKLRKIARKAGVRLADRVMGEGDVIPFKKPDSDLKKSLDAWQKDRDQQRARDMMRLAPDVVDYYKKLVAQGYSYEEAVELIADDNDIDEYDIKRMLQAAGIDDED